MLTKYNQPERPQLTTQASSRTPKALIKGFSMVKMDSLNKEIDRPVRKKSPLPPLIPDPRTSSTSEPIFSDENYQQRSEANPEFPLCSYSKFKIDEHRHKTSDESCLQIRHKATITNFPFDHPVDFQLKNSYPKDNAGEIKDEAEQVSPSIYSDRRSLRTNNHYDENEHEHQDSHQDEYQLQPRRFDPTPYLANNDHNLHECPFYTNEVSNLRLQVIELEFINATLENKVHKYREEIRLFKQDIKGYKLDGRKSADLLMEKENEIETLHRKIVQLLNQDSLSLPPRSTPSPTKDGSYKRYGHIADSSVKRRDFARNMGAQRNSDKRVDQVGRAETDNNPQWWM